MPLYFSQTADKEPLESYGNGIIMMTVVVMVMVVMMIMILSLFQENQVLMFATCEVKNYETGMKEN